jgi:hypothetical protein
MPSARFLRRSLLILPVLASLAMVLSGCATDVYGWTDRQVRTPLPAYFTEVPVSELSRVCGIDMKLHGCARVDYQAGICRVYTGPSPHIETLAHEALHCAGFIHGSAK